jgi:hypothetical protein
VGSLRETTISLLAALLSEFEQDDDLARIVQPVTSPAHHLLGGFYFAVVLPQSSGEKCPVWAVSLLPRGELGYIVLLKTTEEAYGRTHKDLEDFMGGFKLISKIKG